MANCNACHAAGVANAPKLGDKAAWDARLEKGMDALMVNVMNGINAMPAKGLCMSCTQENLQEIVNYMVAR
jgi:cytochrome c5